MDAETTLGVLLEQLVETHIERNQARAQHAALLKELSEIRSELEEFKKAKKPRKRAAR